MTTTQPIVDKVMGKDTHSKKRLGVIGTGNFGRALAKRLVLSEYDVIIGSRQPEARKLSENETTMFDISLETIETCLDLCDTVFIAMHVEHFKDTLSPIAGLFAGKTVIDASNRTKENDCKLSNAEYLQSILVDATIVKGFNTVSAYSMENDYAGASRKVFIASDDVTARGKVCSLAYDMGFTPVDFGRLHSSQKIEAYTSSFFPEWKYPILISTIIFCSWSVYIVSMVYTVRRTLAWQQVFLKVMNKPFYTTAMTVMALIFMPGCIASYLQIIYGTKHRRFPLWVDEWLKARKQFGIICFVLVFVHVLISLLLMSPTYFSRWYQPTAVVVPANNSQDLHLPHKTWMMWNGEAAGLVGIIAFVLLCLLATTTIPSVSDTLNWREWRFVQSYLGFVAMFLSVCHAVIMAIPKWLKEGFPKIFGYFSFLCIILPAIVIIMKLVLLLPCVSKYVSKIRKGWERNRVTSRANPENGNQVRGTRLASRQTSVTQTDKCDLVV